MLEAYVRQSRIPKLFDCLPLDFELEELIF